MATRQCTQTAPAAPYNDLCFCLARGIWRWVRRSASRPSASRTARSRLPFEEAAPESCNHHKNAEFASQTAPRSSCAPAAGPFNQKEKICCRFAVFAQMSEEAGKLVVGIRTLGCFTVLERVDYRVDLQRRTRRGTLAVSGENKGR